jgi:hypothetical protein
MVKAKQSVDDGETVTNVHFDESDNSYKLFAGYMILPFLGVEGGYVNFGAPGKNFNNTVIGNVGLDLDVDGWEAFVVGVLPLGPVDLFAKVGGISYNVDAKVKLNGSTLGSGSDSDEKAAYGVGAAVGLGGIKVRAEYTAYDVSNGLDDLYMYSVGLTYQF